MERRWDRGERGLAFPPPSGRFFPLADEGVPSPRQRRQEQSGEDPNVVFSSSGAIGTGGPGFATAGSPAQDKTLRMR